MNTTRIPLAVILLLLVCIGLVYFIGSLRPFASTERFNNPAQAGQIAVSETPAPSNTPPHLPTHRAGITRIAQATAAPTGLVAEEAEPFTPTQTTPPGEQTLDAVALQTSFPALQTVDAVATQTSVPAQQTLDAIATRAKSTPSPGRADPESAIGKSTNFLLIGADTRTSDPGWTPNTDVMIVLFLDTANQRAALLSLPRDLVVAIPGHQAYRVNSAYHYGWAQDGVEGGVAVLKETLQNDFDIRIDHWALIDLDGLAKIVDTLGGIEVNVSCALSDTIDEQAFTIPAGVVVMDYLTAKRYVQSRYTTSDTSRNYRQQRVLWAMAKKALDLNAPDRVPLLYEQLKDSVATDMSLFDMIGLVPAVYQLDLQSHPERLHARVLEAPNVYPWVSPSGAWLYMPNYEGISETLETIFDAPQAAPSQPAPAECPSRPSTPPPTDAPTMTPTP